jgi:hypothetical protein
MRKASGAVVAMIMAIALYFTFFWGTDAIRVLTSSTYGLDDVWHSQFVFGVGRVLHLDPAGLIKLAAFFAVMKFAAAAVFAVHIVDRFRAMVQGGKPDAEIFEAGLILVVLISIASVAPALWSQNVPLVHEQTVELLVAGLAAALTIIERTQNQEEAEEANEAIEHQTAGEPKVIAPQGASWFRPWR